MNKSNPNIDELLNGFIDEELTENQKAEVERLIADDAQIAHRLRQLQKTKMLVNLLPRAKAPTDIIERIKASLGARTLLAQQPVFSEHKETMQCTAWLTPLLVRRVLTAAAMIALLAILSGVIYTIVAPETIPDRPAKIVEATEMGFSGRLKLKTAALPAVDGFINRFIDENSLTDSVSIERQTATRLYTLSCSRQSLNSLLAGLNDIWQRFDSASLSMDTEHFGEPVTINAITAEQIFEIINQENLDMSKKAAKDFAVLNNMAELMPGKQILTAIDDKKVNLINPPKPFFTGDQKVTRQAEEKKEVTLTIMVTAGE